MGELYKFKSSNTSVVESARSTGGRTRINYIFLRDLEMLPPGLFKSEKHWYEDF